MAHVVGVSARLLLVLLLGCFSLNGQSGGYAQQEEAERLFTETVPVEDGDRCIVCNTPLEAEDTVYLVEGQRVGIMEAMEPQLFNDPWAYIARLKPRGGLFGGEVAPGEESISDAWLLLGIYVLLGLVFSALTAHRALNTGQPVIRWFAGGLFLNVLAYLALLVRSTDQEQRADTRYRGVVKIPSTTEPLSCPQCDALNHPSASICSKCGSKLTPAVTSEVTTMRSPASS